MITNISITTVFCTDLDETRNFYVNTLGFEPGDDITMGDYRWLTVKHPSQPELSVHLMPPGPPLDDELSEAITRSLGRGSMTGLGLTVDDCQKTFEELSAKGVTFLQEPADRPYGVEAVMRDNAGNWVVLVERKEYSPEDFEGFDGS